MSSSLPKTSTSRPVRRPTSSATWAMRAALRIAAGQLARSRPSIAAYASTRPRSMPSRTLVGGGVGRHDDERVEGLLVTALADEEAPAGEQHALDHGGGELGRRQPRVARRQLDGEPLLVRHGVGEVGGEVAHRGGVDTRAGTDAEGDERPALRRGHDEGRAPLGAEAGGLERRPVEAQVTRHRTVRGDRHRDRAGPVGRRQRGRGDDLDLEARRRDGVSRPGCGRAHRISFGDRARRLRATSTRDSLPERPATPSVGHACARHAVTQRG